MATSTAGVVCQRASVKGVADYFEFFAIRELIREVSDEGRQRAVFEYLDGVKKRCEFLCLAKKNECLREGLNSGSLIAPSEGGAQQNYGCYQLIELRSACSAEGS